MSFIRALVTSAAGLDPTLSISVPEGHGLGEVRQLVGSNEGASRKDRRRKLTKVPVQPPREEHEREYRSTKEMKAEGERARPVRDTRKQIKSHVWHLV